MMKRRIGLALALTLTLAVAACGNNGNSSPSSNKSGASGSASANNDNAEPRTLVIALANGIPKISVLDENGKWQGYDYEVLTKIDEILPQYVFKYEPITDFQAAFVGLDTKAYDILSIHASWTEERAQKYLLGEASHYENSGYTLRVKKGSGIVVNSDEDLGGLKIAVPPGTSVAGLSEKFNETHSDNPIEIVWDSGTLEQQLAILKSGAVDGLFGEKLNDQATLEAYGPDAFDVTGDNLFYDPAKKNGTYLLYNYGSESLQQELDTAINKLLADGTLSKLSLEILGIDVTVKPL
ncbi:transporter substrate-binding domain-containing protein [Cohnella cellulosilytica]